MRQIVAIGLALFCLVLVLSRAVAVRMSRPINALTMNVEALAAGRFVTSALPLSRQGKSSPRRGPSSA